MQGGRRIPGYAYPDRQLLLHRFAKSYGWTQRDIDLSDTEDVDWLIRIQDLEVELQDDAQKKHEAEMKRMSSSRRGRR